MTPASYWKQVREACERATPGPWHTVDEQGTPWNIDSADGDSVAMSHQLVGDRNHAMRKANADFISLSRTALPLALARIEELEAALRPLSAIADAFDVKRGTDAHADHDQIHGWCVTAKDGTTIERALTVGMLRAARAALGKP